MPIQHIGQATGRDPWVLLGHQAMNLTGDIVQQENAKEIAAINAYYKAFIEADSEDQLQALTNSPNHARVMQKAQRLGLPVEQDPNVPGGLRFPYGPTIRGIQERKQLVNTPQLPGGLTPEDIQGFQDAEEAKKLTEARVQAGAKAFATPTPQEAELLYKRGKVEKTKYNKPFPEPAGWNVFHQQTMQGDKENLPFLDSKTQRYLQEQGIDPRKLYLDFRAGNINKEQLQQIISGEGDMGYQYMAKDYAGRYRIGADGTVMDKATGKPLTTIAQEFGKIPVWGPMMLQEYQKSGQLSKESMALLASDAFLRMGLFPGIDPREGQDMMNQVAAGKMDWTQLASGAAGERYSGLAKFFLELTASQKGKDETAKNVIELMKTAQAAMEHHDKMTLDAEKLILEGAKPEVVAQLINGYTSQGMALIDTLRKISPPGVQVDWGKMLTPMFGRTALKSAQLLSKPFDPKVDKPADITNRFMNFNVLLNQLPSNERDMMLREALNYADKSGVPYILVDKESLKLNLDTPVDMVLDDPIYSKLLWNQQDPVAMIPATAFKITPLNVPEWVQRVNSDFANRRFKQYQLDPSKLQTMSPRLMGGGMGTYGTR